MSQLFFLLILLACPLSMMFMMRGMHGGHDAKQPQIIDATAGDARITELEREVASLRGQPLVGAEDRPAVSAGRWNAR